MIFFYSLGTLRNITKFLSKLATIAKRKNFESSGALTKIKIVIFK